MKKNYLITFSLILLLLISISCNTTEPPFKEEPPKAIKLKLLDVSCTEAFINVNAADSVLPVLITLKKDNTPLFNFTLTKTDTVVIDTTLQPNTTYIYQTTEEIKGKEENSDTINVKTLPTTSHNFIWQKYEFGGIGGSSVLYDVAIINENDIWAVGEIYADTTGQAYNAVHWDGTTWKLLKLQFYTFCGQTHMGSYPASAVYAFDDGSVVIGSASQVTYLNGENQIKTECIPLTISINKIWGNSSNDFYVVGNSGSIAHYQNGAWRKVESGTDTRIQDIWGCTNPNSQLTKVLIVMSNPAKIMSLSSNTATDTLNWPMDKGLGSVWFDNYHLVVGNGGIWAYRNSNWEKMESTPEFFPNTLRGDKINNLFVAAWGAKMSHFNGIEWQSVTNIPSNISFTSMSVKNKVVVAVGFTSSGGLVGAAAICMASY